MAEEFLPEFDQEEIRQVYKKIYVDKSRALNNNLLFSSGNGVYGGKYTGYSLKRSILSNSTFSGAVFDHTSLAGSILNNIQVKADCSFDSVYMEKSMISDLHFDQHMNIINCNFSESMIQRMTIQDSLLRSTYFNDSTLVECDFSNSMIRSTMFDNAALYNCVFRGCDMQNLNLDFCKVYKTSFIDTKLPYFQIAYVIGIFDEDSILSNVEIYMDKEHYRTIDEYIERIHEPIVYYTSLKEYFPLANLYYKAGDIKSAKSSIATGINSSLIQDDIKMVERYCILGIRYDLLTISDIKQILEDTDCAIEKKKDSVFYSMLLRQTHQLKAVISGSLTKSTLEITINTNIASNEYSEVAKLCEEIDEVIHNISSSVNSEFTISHNSPFEVILTCIGVTADLLAISQALYSYIKARAKVLGQSELFHDCKQSMKQEINKDIDKLKTDINNAASNKKRKKVIEKFRSKLISNFDAEIDKAYSLFTSYGNQI